MFYWKGKRSLVEHFLLGQIIRPLINYGRDAPLVCLFFFLFHLTTSFLFVLFWLLVAGKSVYIVDGIVMKIIRHIIPDDNKKIVVITLGNVLFLIFINFFLVKIQCVVCFTPIRTGGKCWSENSFRIKYNCSNGTIEYIDNTFMSCPIVSGTIFSVRFLHLLFCFEN